MKQKYDIKRLRFPLDNGKILTQDGYIVTGVAPRSQVVVMNETTGKGVAPVASQGYGYDDSSRKKNRVPAIIKELITELNFGFYWNIDDRSWVYYGNKDSVEGPELQTSNTWNDVNFTIKPLDYFYVFGQSTTTALQNFAGRITLDNEKILYTGEDGWETAATNGTILPTTPEIAQTLLNQVDSNWNTNFVEIDGLAAWDPPYSISRWKRVWNSSFVHDGKVYIFRVLGQNILDNSSV